MTSPTPDALQRFLARLLQRSPLNAAEQAAILALPTRAHQVEAKRDIVSPGVSTDHACLVVDGLIARFDQMQDGRRQIVSFYLPGDMCDLQSAVVDIPGWGLEAMCVTTALYVPHKALREIVHAYPEIAMAFWRDTTADGSIIAKWVGNLGRRQALPRLAHLMCEMGVRMEHAGLGARNHFRLKANQTQLADATGLTPVHLNRTLKAIRPSGLTFRGGFVRIDDWEVIANLAEFDPAYLLLDGQDDRDAA